MFETASRLSASGSWPGDRRLRSLPVSLALHGLALGAAALLSVRTLSDSLEPPIPVVFFEGSAPPLSMGENVEVGDTATARPAAEVEAPSAALEQPDETGEEETEQDLSSDGPSLKDGRDSTSASAGDPSGQTGGHPDGRAGSGGVDGKEGGDSQLPYRPGGNVAAPRLLDRIEPAYPEIARKARIEGIVVLEAIIGRSGRVEDLHLVKSVNLLLDAAALDAVKQWRYRPATLDGLPVRVFLTVTVDFRLR